LEIKVSKISDAQARQFWNAIKNSRVQLTATSDRLAALKRTESATRWALREPVVGRRRPTIKDIGTAVYAKLTIPADVARSYRQAGIKVFLYTSTNASQDAKMIALQPWRDATKGPA
jgi:hypothetical protein